MLSQLLSRIADLTPPAPLTSIENGWLSAEEQRILYSCAYILDGPFLEMGAWVGKSTSVLARGIRDSGIPKRFVTSEIGPALEHYRIVDGEAHYFAVTDSESVSIGHVPEAAFEQLIKPILCAPGGVIGCLERNLTLLGLFSVVQIHVGDFATAPDLDYQFIFNDCAHNAFEIEKTVPGLRRFIGKNVLFLAAHDYSPEGEAAFRKHFDIHESTRIDSLYLCTISNRPPLE